MIQELVLNIPFPSRINVDIDGIRQRTLAWLRACGLMKSDAAVKRYLDMDITGLGARWYPDATGEELDIAVLSVCIATFLDDQFDGVLANQTDEVAKVIQDLIRLMQPGDPVLHFPDSPLVQTYAAYFSRNRAGATPSWYTRHCLSWENYLKAMVVEVEHNRTTAVFENLEDFLVLRRETGFMRIAIDMLERTGHYELSPELLSIDTLQEMITLTCDIIDAANDIHSLRKEEIRNDTLHNIVACLQQLHHCSQTAALEITLQLIDNWSTRFQSLAQETPVLSQILHLSEKETRDLQLYITGLSTLMSGYYLWGRATKKYHEDNIIPPGQHGFTESYL
ncbi:terpene synthase family protein [Chitinophaga nivalis]|uniref:Terpene synthase n=1 Tax=Chitinophaga nivalis TaxID=2991709 RepID=A0ABT3IS71_9BACT|nr:hypothetical protein [Chitinophaga nivalis]MCW3463499.1 hypothetical protein [Chitinophaga nivalis]MCW3486811.1 hypothetical protein [Chitinophaga nivalis]